MNDRVERKMHFGRTLMAATRKAAVTLPLVIGVLNVPPSQGQSPDARPEFEVASVKLGVAGQQQFLGVRSGTFRADNISLRFLIRVAYGVRSFNVSGGPAWIDSEAYVITAKPRVIREGAKASTLPEMYLMLQVLLEDRFKLKVHRETRELPVYELTVAKSGLKMQPAKCTPGPPPPQENRPTGSGAQVAGCGSLLGGVNGLNRTENGIGTEMPSLLTFLANLTRREVIDKTGLTGRFDLHLEWTSDEALGAPPDPLRPDDATKPAPSASAGPSIFTARRIDGGCSVAVDAAHGCGVAHPRGAHDHLGNWSGNADLANRNRLLDAGASATHGYAARYQ
jgi:uncharacterized protein (TIGR03435 family)